MTHSATRRGVLASLATSTLAATTLGAPSIARTSPTVAVIGGGFGGATAARELVAQGIGAILIEPSATYTSCPSSNAAIVGLRPLSSLAFDYAGIARAGVTVVQDAAKAIDAHGRRVHLTRGGSIAYDRLIVSPGIALRFDAIPGYDAHASERMPHAWKAGPQTALLARQLDALEDGGLVVLTVPAMPYRCPPGPYERASLIAHFLKTRKPRSKLILLDAKDTFSKQPLFDAAWKTLYPDHLEYVPCSKGGEILSVDAGTMTVEAKAGRFKAAVGNIIPPQHAPDLCFEAGLADPYGWCRIDAATFESIRIPGIHVIGDASAAGAMPKSAFAANAQAKVCAQAVADLLGGRAPQKPKLINTCYSLVAPDYGISIADVYEVEWDLLAAIPQAHGLSPLNAPSSVRAQEAAYSAAWYRTITQAVFG